MYCQHNKYWLPVQHKQWRIISVVLMPYRLSITPSARCSAVQYKENMELRMKHTDNPEKFMTSELDLDEEVRR